MYKGSHNKAQRRADGLTPRNLMHGDEVLTPEQKRDALVSAKKRVTEEIIQSPKGSLRRKELAKKQAELDRQIHELRPKLKGPSSVNSLFISVAREKLSRFQYEQIMAEAARRAEEQPTKGSVTGEREGQ